ncbi:unnamed protein product [Adineta steineri]|uniref:Major facilitator superfamily (MFS) profile domain-containing protein n=1 Tax=Adineta steineri TaxID=433720 RepID=A0A814DLS2_9BILA|nr:unnamed protein product [Adineta steineri]CAF3620371.1 unnamed protein product [Adineta steineri]
MGLGGALIGPTLLKFGEQINLPFDRIVYILSVRSFGFFSGTIIGGYIIDAFPKFGGTFLTFALFIMCITTLIIPLMYYLVPMMIVHLMWSIAAGIVDNLAQILTMRHYKNFNVNPYLQALHGAFGIGALLSPLIIAPFLRKSSSIDQWHYAYWLIGCLHIPNILGILIFAIRDECCSKQVEEINLETKEFVEEKKQKEAIIESDPEVKINEGVCSGNVIFLGLMSIFLLLYVGNETAYGSYLHTYASLHLKFPKDIAAYLNSIFWTSFTFSRLCGIPLSIKFSAVQMITFDLIGCMISLTLIFIFNKISWVLWAGSIFYGLSVGTLYASAIAFTEKYIPVTGKRMSILAIGGSAGDAIIPLLIGYSINSKFIGPIGFISILCIGTILASLFFGFIFLYVRHMSKEDMCDDKKTSEVK